MARHRGLILPMATEEVPHDLEASCQVLGDDRTTNGALSVRTIGLACGGEAGDQCSIIWFEIEYINQLF